MKVKEILNCLRAWAPETYQESYDNSGLIVGEETADVDKALISLDCTEAVVDEAIAGGFNLIISHHPIVFSGLKRFNNKNYIERVVQKAIKHDINVYAIHTNLDNVNNGVNQKFMDMLGIKNTRILKPMGQVLHQLVYYVPKDHQQQVLEAVLVAGAGEVGNYSSCSFSHLGEGTFKPEAGANPFKGEKGEIHKEEEVKVELLVQSHQKQKVQSALMQAHPYEEVAHNWTILENKNQDLGSGMVGELSHPEEMMAFLSRVKGVFGCGAVRYTKPHKKMVSTVAVCGGSGSFLLGNALGAKADVFITADYKYHQFFDAEGRIVIADIGHYESEKFTMQLIRDYLYENLPTFATCLTKSNTNPVHYL
ncbi:MAG: dinuclear metal center YbgI/SA1388 family protein [Luteibaculaceae bacterium]